MVPADIPVGAQAPAIQEATLRIVHSGVGGGLWPEGGDSHPGEPFQPC